MIVSFRDRETERVWMGEGSRRLPPWILGVAVRKLRLLNDQWRICFRWGDRGPEDVEIVDYHY